MATRVQYIDSHNTKIEIPSDSNDPDRLNKIDATSLPKNEPMFSEWDFAKRFIIAPVLIGSSAIKN